MNILDVRMGDLDIHYFNSAQKDFPRPKTNFSFRNETKGAKFKSQQRVKITFLQRDGGNNELKDLKSLMTRVSVPARPIVNLLDEIADFKSRAELDVHVFHHHLRVEQQQSLAIDFLE